MTDSVIEKFQNDLNSFGVTNVSTYISKLHNNSNNKRVFEDLLFEGRAALMFLLNNIHVDMRESPDLGLEFEGNSFYAEVKHFRLKEQDKIDQVNMEMAEDLVEIGNTIPLEKRSAWDQVSDVAKNKVNQYIDGAQNILVLASSSSNCIDDSIIPTSIRTIREEVSDGSFPGLEKLNGILLMSRDFNIKQNRNVHFYPTSSPILPLSPIIRDALNSIKRWSL